MADVSTFMAIDAGDIASIMGIDVGDIEAVMGVDMPAAGPAYTGQTFICFGGSTAATDGVVDIDKKSSTSNGNAGVFGELREGTWQGAAAGSQGARAVFAGGVGTGASWTAGRTEMEYITIASDGDSQTAGDLTVARSEGPGGAGNGTTGIWAGGYNSGYTNVMDYMTLSSTSGASDMGDLNNNTGNGNCSGSLARFFHSGGNDLVQQIDYMSFSATPGGTASDWGDLQLPTRSNGGGISSEAVICNSQGGTELTSADPYSETARTVRMDWINPASVGSIDDFGDLVEGRRYASGGFSDNTRGEIWGGATGSSPYRSNMIQYVDIAGKGNATEAGDMTIVAAYRSYSGASG